MWGRAGLFALPLVLVAALLEWTLWRSGESWPLSRVAAMQQAEAAIFLRELMPQDVQLYKLERLALSRPRVLVVGSSRTMQLRAAMLGETTATFFNAGGTIDTLGDLGRVLGAVQRPEVIVLGVDSWWFSTSSTAAERDPGRDGALDWRAHVAAGRRLLQRPGQLADLLRGPSAADTRRIGAAALRASAGFRQDGSLRLTFARPDASGPWTYVDRETPPVIERVRAGRLQFLPSTGLDAGRLDRLRGFLAQCRARGITVLGFAPPFSAEVVAALSTDDRHRRLTAQFRAALPATFAAAGFPFVDATDLREFGLDDRYLVDGFHAGETFHLHLLRRILRHPVAVAVLPGAAAAVDRLLALPGTDYWYVGGPLTIPGPDGRLFEDPDLR